MASLFKLPDVWRVLREVDLEEIRRDAQSRFRIVVVADDPAAGDRLSTLVAGEEGHPWIDVVAAGEGVPEPSTATLALLVSADEQPAEGLAAAGRALRTAGVPVVSVVVGAQRRSAALARAAETARVVVPALDEDALPAIADAIAEGPSRRPVCLRCPRRHARAPAPPSCRDRTTTPRNPRAPAQRRRRRARRIQTRSRHRSGHRPEAGWICRPRIA
jgi:hypothetical protein